MKNHIKPLSLAIISLAFLLTCAVPTKLDTNPDHAEIFLITATTPTQGYYPGDTAALTGKVWLGFLVDSCKVTGGGNVFERTFYRDTVFHEIESVTVKIPLTTPGNTPVLFRLFMQNGNTRDTTLTIAVNGFPPILKPLQKTFYQLTTGVHCTLDVELQTGTLPVHYQWVRNTVLRLEDSLPRLIVGPVQESDSGVYRCVARNGWGQPDTGEAIRIFIVQTPPVKHDTNPNIIPNDTTPPSTAKQNHKPVLLIIGKTVHTVGEICSLTVTATDSDSGQTVAIQTLKRPTGSTFVKNVFIWQTATAGTDTATFTASDNGAPASADTQRIVLRINAKPDTTKPTMCGIVSFAPKDNDTAADTGSGIILSWVGNGSLSCDSILYIIKYGTDTTDLKTTTTRQTKITLTGLGDNMRYFWCILLALGIDTLQTPATAQQYNKFTVKKGAIAQPNHPPKIVPVNNVVTKPDSQIKFTVTANDTDGQKPTLSADLLKLPKGNTATFTPANGLFNWTPTIKDTGDFSITFFANDGSLKDTATVNLKIVPIKEEPQIIVSDTAIDEGSSLMLTVIVVQKGNATPELTNTEKPSGASFAADNSGKGVLSWKPGFDASANSPYYVTFRTPGSLFYVEKTIKITVRDVKYKLAITQPANGEITTNPATQDIFDPGQIITISVRATNDSCYFAEWLGDISGNANPRTVIINSNLALAARMPYKPSASKPAFTPQPDTFLNSVSITLATETQGAVIYYSTDGTIPLAADKCLYKTPFTLTQSATVKAYTVLSGHLNSDLVAKAYTINHSPVFVDSEIVQKIYVGEKYIAKVRATDADGDAVKYKKVNAPAGVTIDSINGLITWPVIRTENPPGGYSITISAVDGRNGSTNKTLTIQVLNNELPIVAPDAPVDSAQFSYVVQMDQQKVIDLGVNASDIDGKIDSVKFFINDSLVITKTGPSSPGFYLYTHTFINPNYGKYWYAIRYRAFDNRGEYTDKVVRIVIDAINYRG